MKTLLTLALVLFSLPASASNTWFVTPTGGTRYSSAVPFGQCTGLSNAAYPGATTNTWGFGVTYATTGAQIAFSDGYYYTVTTAGTTSTTTYPTSGTTMTDGTVVWTRGAAYPVNQACAFNDVRYLWSDNSGNAPAWVIAGGDTAVIYGCKALGTQTNPSNPHCRLGYDNALNGNYPNDWCGYGNPNYECYNPPIPAGTSGNPTKILGGCAYGTYTCTPIGNKYPYGTTNETQLFAGFALSFSFNLQATSYVTIEGIELTTHNGVCTASTGTPSYPRSCSTGTPYDDFANNGFITSNATSNLVMQDVYVHGMAAAGFLGPIGGPITMTRVFSGFNAFAGYNFDDTALYNGSFSSYSITSDVITLNYTGGGISNVDAGMLITMSGFPTSTFLNGQTIQLTSATSTQMVGAFTHANTATTTESGSWQNVSTPDATGSSINAQYVTMIFNGCYEQYPITSTYPAQVCYDTNSSGFGDSWSGQGTGGYGSTLTAFTCNYCVDDYNTKDGFIGPHIASPTITITNSVAIGNMGSNWKWGGDDSLPNTTYFENNLTVNNCTRMSAAMTGVPSTYNQYLTGFCRAGGNGMANVIPIGSTWNLINNTFISAQQIALYVACSGTDTTCPSTINSTNNVFLGYVDPNNPYGADDVPTLYYFSPGIVLNTSHNDEFGMSGGTCPSTTNGVICGSPALVSQPSQTWVSEAALDVFNPFVTNNSFYPTSGSPVLAAGASGGPSTDYYGVATTSPPVIGGVNYVAAPSYSGSYGIGFSCTGCSIH